MSRIIHDIECPSCGFQGEVNDEVVICPECGQSVEGIAITGEVLKTIMEEIRGRTKESEG